MQRDRDSFSELTQQSSDTESNDSFC